MPVLSQLGAGLSTLLAAVATTGFGVAGEWKLCASTGMSFVLQAVLLACMVLAERQVVFWLLCFGVASIAASAAQDKFIYGAGWADVGSTVTSNQDIPTALIAAAILALRHLALSRARRLVIADSASYNELWRTVVASNGAADALTELTRRVASLTAACACQCNGARIWQCNRALRPPCSSGAPVPGRAQWGEECGVEGTVDAGRPVDSLDQLFAQAAVLHPILLAKVRAWAAASRGGFPVHGGEGFIIEANSTMRAWSEDSSESAYSEGSEATQLPNQGLPKFARVKTVARSVEKLVRAYGQASTQPMIPIHPPTRRPIYAQT